MRGWYLGVSPAITDRKVVHVWFDTESGRDKAGLTDELLSVRGVEMICNYLGPRMSLILLHRNEKDLEDGLRGISKLVRSSKLFHAQGAPPRDYWSLTVTDEGVLYSR